MVDGLFNLVGDPNERGNDRAENEGGVWAKTNKECRLNFSVAFKRSHSPSLGSSGTIKRDGENLVVLSCELNDSWTEDISLWEDFLDIIGSDLRGSGGGEHNLVLVGNVEQMQATKKAVPAIVEIQLLHRVRDVFAGKMYLSAADGLSHTFRVRFPAEGEVDSLLVGNEMTDQSVSQMIEGASQIVQGIPCNKGNCRWYGALNLDDQGLFRGLALLANDHFYGMIRQIGVNEPIELVDVLLGPLNL